MKQSDQAEEELIKCIAKDVLNETALIVTPILDKGEVNRIFAIETKKTKYIFRINNKNELDRFRKEEWCNKQALAVGIPSPSVLSTGSRDSIAYMILSYIDGTEASDHSQDCSEIWRTLGSYAQNFREIQTEGFGEKMIEPGVFEDPSWTRYLKYNIQSLTSDDELIKLKVIDLKKSEEIRHIFESLEKLELQFGLCHGDISLNNTMIGNDGKIYLLDWGCAEVHAIPYLDIICILENGFDMNSKEMSAFLGGYDSFKMNAENLQLVYELSLLRSIDKFRWAIDHKQNNLHGFIDRIKSAMSHLKSISP